MFLHTFKKWRTPEAPPQGGAGDNETKTDQEPKQDQGRGGGMPWGGGEGGAPARHHTCAHACAYKRVILHLYTMQSEIWNVEYLDHLAPPNFRPLAPTLKL